MIGMEVSASQAFLIEINPSTFPMKLSNFALIELFSSSEENIAIQIRDILEKGRFKNKKCGITISSSANHRILSLPLMSKSETDIVIDREVREAGGPEEIVFDWQVIGEGVKEGAKKRDILVVSSPLKEVNEKVSLLKSSGLGIGRITTVPFALFLALNFIEGEKTGVLSFLYIGREKGYLLFVREGKWCFSREFPLKGDGYDEDSILSEMNRSIRYFKQLFPDEELSRVIVAGVVLEYLELSKISIEEKLEVKAEIFYPHLDLTPMKARAKEIRRVLPCLAIPLGLAWPLPPDRGINLTPPLFKRKARLARMKILAYRVTLGLAIFSLITYLVINRVLGDYQEILNEKEVSIKKLKPFLEEVSQVEKERELYRSRLSLLEGRRQKAIWEEVFKELSLMVPEEMVFHSLKIEGIEGKLRADLQGEVVATDTVTAQGAFNRFYSHIKRYPRFTGVELQPMDVELVKEKEIEKEVEKSRIKFHIKFQISEAVKRDGA